MMNMENTDEKKTVLLKKKSERKALAYIFSVNIILLVIILIATFSLPKIIEAYTTAQYNRTEYAMDRAEELLNRYRDTSLALFEKDEEEKSIEDYFNIFPQPEYPEDVDFYQCEGWFSPGSSVTRAAWRHAYDLYYSGKIHGATAGRWCTFFAQMWFNDMYGFNSSGNSPTGDGSQFVYTVYETAVYRDEEGNLKHYFEYGDRPMTMGIVSIRNSYLPEGHVICIDEVDYFENTITVSEGNVNGCGDIRIRHTMSLDTFYRIYPGRKTYVNPTPELIAMVSENKE